MTKPRRFVFFFSFCTSSGAVSSYAMFTRTPRAVFLVFFWRTQQRQAWQCRRYKDQLKRQLAQAGVDHKAWQTLASDRVKWRSANKRVAQQIEDSRVNTAKEKRKHRKESANQATSCSNQTLPYPTCSRICKSRIGLISHQRACRWSSEYEESAIIISSSSTFIVVVVFSRNYAVTDFLVCDKT